MTTMTLSSKTTERRSRDVAVPAMLAMLAVIASSAVGCAAGESIDDESIETQAAALRNTSGGDPDECKAAQQGCYASCARSGSSSCYRYCDIVYTKCRGLPDPSIGFAARAVDSPLTAQ